MSEFLDLISEFLDLLEDLYMISPLLMSLRALYARRALQGLTECIRKEQDRIIECISARRGRLSLVQPKYLKGIKG